MKKEKEIFNRNLALALVFIIFSILSLLFAVKISYADEPWLSESIAYDNSISGLKSNNVKDALDEINSIIDGNEYTVKNEVKCTEYTDACKKENISNPQTGDKNIWLICLLIGVSTLALIFSIVFLIKGKKKV